MKTLLLTITLLATYSSSYLVQASSLHDQLAEFIETRNLPGMVVAVNHQGQEVFHEAIGYANFETKEPITKDHRFKWYSMSKPVTSIAFLKAMESNGLDLDKTLLQDIYPAFNEYPEIPLKQIATHTAGFLYGGDWASIAGWKYWWHGPLENSQNLTEMMSTLAKIPLANEPGEVWHYSMSQDIQGAIIEELSGTSLDRYMQENIFAPLSMTATGFLQKNTHIPNLAPMHRYERDDKVSKLRDDQSEWDKALLAGGSGLYGTAGDFMNFLGMLSAPNEYASVLDPKLTKTALKNQLPDNISAIPHDIYPNSGYGYGLGVKLVDEEFMSKDSVYWAGKGGTLFWVDPQKELSVVVMTQLESARVSLEKYLVPMIYNWIDGK